MEIMLWFLLGCFLGTAIGVILTLSRLRRAERVLRCVEEELAVPSSLRMKVTQYFYIEDE
jgi:hypothetical protein